MKAMKAMKVMQAWLLILVFVLPAVFPSCKPKPEGGTPTDSGTGEKTEIIADIPQRAYNTHFTILNPNRKLLDTYYWCEDEKAGTSIDAANYGREAAIEEHLGIEIFHELYELKEGTLYRLIEQQNLTGTEAYQLFLTHSFQDLVSIVTTDSVQDLSQVSGVSLNEDYWNTQIMEQVRFQGHMFLGSSSFILHEPVVMLFNKNMAGALLSDGGAAQLYDHVREKTWTIEQMQTYAKMVDTGMNSSLANKKDGTYGFATLLDWELASFAQANHYFHGTVTEEGSVKLQAFNDDIFKIFQKVVGLVDQEYTYSWRYSDIGTGAELSISTGRVLFATSGTPDMIPLMLESEIPIGVLPYPTIEAGMSYQSLDWAGYFAVPQAIANTQMSGEVAELLSWYGENTIKNEFYNVLLGLRASNEPEDREMLALIFDNLVADPALPYMNEGASPVAYIFYVISRMLSKGERGMAGWYAQYYDPAQAALKF